MAFASPIISNYSSIKLELTFSVFFFFNDTATTEIYTLSLHDALPISYLLLATAYSLVQFPAVHLGPPSVLLFGKDRKSTRLNSSHGYISYAVFCLKKKKTPLDPPDQKIRLKVARNATVKPCTAVARLW